MTKFIIIFLVLGVLFFLFWWTGKDIKSNGKDMNADYFWGAFKRIRGIQDQQDLTKDIDKINKDNKEK